MFRSANDIFAHHISLEAPTHMLADTQVSFARTVDC